MVIAAVSKPTKRWETNYWDEKWKEMSFKDQKSQRNFRRESAVGKSLDGSQVRMPKYQAEFSVSSNAGSQVIATTLATGATAKHQILLPWVVWIVQLFTLCIYTIHINTILSLVPIWISLQFYDTVYKFITFFVSYICPAPIFLHHLTSLTILDHEQTLFLTSTFCCFLFFRSK